MGSKVSYPYQDSALSIEQRVADLLSRMTLQDKAGLMFHDMIIVGPGGTLTGADNHIRRPATVDAVQGLRMNHFNVLGPLGDTRDFAQWHNRVQELALQTPLGIPISLSTDPRHAFTSNLGTAAAAGTLSQWPETLGLAALRDPAVVERFADIARQEYVAAGLRVALHPQIDLSTEPRWARTSGTFGEDADLTSELGAAYIRGFRGSDWHSGVSTMAKHFPGGGPQKDGEDPHFPYGKEQVYPGGRFDYHLQPFLAALEAGVTQIMPYYGVPVGTEYEEVAFGFNRGIITDLLRERLGFDGIVCTDWNLLVDGEFLGEPMEARAWGIESLSTHDRALRAIEAGVDQFGGESHPELLIDLVSQGRLPESRLDESVRRLLAEKFRLGLFDNPFVDVEHAVATVGRSDFVEAGRAAQRAALVRLTESSGSAALPLAPGLRVYTEGLDDGEAARLGTVVGSPAEADVAVLRLRAPFEPRPGRFESMFHAGSLEYPADELDRVLAVCEAVPTIVDVYLDRAAVLTEIASVAAVLIVDFGAEDAALVDVLLGAATARGRLPFDLPRSMAAVEASAEDAPFDTADPLFRFGAGL
ncbi:MAG: glycoside hydrolase family 3 N-terminal domain-containing protein [Gordonia sp. (in: high G+C Gram-positive bacteria)]